jgi:ABC-type oligopeptide transport system ATPase subunit
MLPNYPYPGLRPYEEKDSEIFFGRTELIEKLYSKLKTTRFISVVGESGCGKSSLVKAGLFPKVVSLGWGTIKTKPGKNPIDNLVNALREFFDGTKKPSDNFTSLKNKIDLNSNGLTEIYFQSGYKNPLLICIDQFEEIFDYAFEKEDDGKRRLQEAIRLVNLLISTSKQDEFEIYVLITMRSDFVGACSRFKGLPELISEGQFLTPRLTRYQYQEAIVNPLRLFNYRISPNVVSQMLNDVEDDPDQLPILQHALRRIWEEKNKTRLDIYEVNLDDYIKAGGVMAIEHHANELIASLSDESLDQTKVIFKALTELVITQDKESGIRKRRKMSELIELTRLTSKEILSIVSIFSRDGVNFLQTSDTNKGDGLDTLIDLSHESLIRKWPELFFWMRLEYNDKVTLKRLVDEAKSYKASITGLLSSRAISFFDTWPKVQEQIDFLRWSKRYSTASEIENSLSFLNKSRRNENIKKLRSVLLIALSVLIPVLLIIFLSNNQRSYEVIRNFSKNDFKSTYNSILNSSGSYPAFVSAENWANTSKQVLSLPFGLHEVRSSVTFFLDSISKNLDTLVNKDPLYVRFKSSSRVIERFSPNRRYSFAKVNKAGNDIDSVCIVDYADGEKKRYITYNSRYGNEYLGFSADEKYFFRLYFGDVLFNSFREGAEQVLEFFPLSEELKPNVIRIPSSFDYSYSFQDIIYREPGIYSVYFTHPDYSGKNKLILYEKYQYIDGKGFDKKPKLTFPVTFYDRFNGYHFGKGSLIPFKRENETWSYYDKVNDTTNSLSNAWDKLKIRDILSNGDGKIIILDDSYQVYLNSDTLYKNSSLKSFRDSTKMIINNVSSIDASLLAISGRVSINDKYTPVFILYSITQDKIYPITNALVNLDQFFVPYFKNDLIIVDQKSPNFDSFIIFLDKLPRKLEKWKLDKSIPVKYKLDFHEIGIQPRKEK